MAQSKVIGRISVKVLPDTSEFRERAKRDLEAIQEQLKEIKVKLDLDKTAMRKLKKDLKDWAKDISPLEITVKPTLLKGSTTYINARLKAVARPREVEFFPKINNAALAKVATALAAMSGARVVGDILDDIGRSLLRLDKAVPIIGGIALAVLGLAGATIASASNAAALAVALAQMLPVGFALAGAFTGMVLGVGALVIALRDMTKVIPEIKTAWEQIKTTVSDNFWAKAEEPIRRLVTGLLPQFVTGMGSASTALGTFGAKLSTALNGALNGQIKGMFDDLTSSINIASGAAGSIASIIKTLGELGASYLPRMSTWFVDLTKQFAGFLERAAADGSLKSWVEQGIANLNALGSVAKSIGQILGGIGTAAQMGGGASLQGFATTLEQIAKVAQSPVFQGGLAAVFEAAHTAMGNIGKVSGPAIADLFGNLGNIINGPMASAGTAIGHIVKMLATALSSPAIAKGLSAMMDGLMRGIIALNPAIQALAPVFGLLGEVIGQFAQILGPLISAILPPLAAAFMQIVPALMPIVQILGGALIQIVTALAPVLATLAQLIAQVLVAVTPLLPPLIQLVMAILVPLLTIIVQIISTALPPLISAFTRLVGAVIPVVNVLTAVVSVLMAVLGPVITWLAGIIMSVLIVAIEAIAQVFRGVVGIVMGIWNAWSALFRGDWAAVWNGVKQVWKGVWDLIVGILKFAFSNVIGVFRAETKLISSIWSTCWNAVKNFFVGIWNSLTADFSRRLSLVKSSLSSASSSIRTLWSTCWSAVLSYLRAALSNLQSAVSNAMGKVTSTLRGLRSSALSALGNLGSALINAGRQLIEGFISGIKQKIGGVKATLQGLTSSLTSWKGPESLDKVLLVNAGRLIIDGFIRGLESRYGEVRRSLQWLTNEVASTDFGLPDLASGGLSARLSAAVDGSAESGSRVTKVINYHAAPGSSISSEEDLFSALDRARAGW
ncbi:hypothetical protein [Micromonospora sp. NPDC049240]|uniref:phage tail protein n=1 Tax=Micromonospora sp. NPDC049240 TaxID=3155151 RepID=UPI0033FBCDCC